MNRKPNDMTTLTTHADLYASLSERANADGPQWLRDLRARGLAAFEAQGFPTIRDEEWRFFTIVLLVAAGAVTLLNVLAGDAAGEQGIRDGLFQVLAITTTTGYVSADYELSEDISLSASVGYEDWSGDRHVRIPHSRTTARVGVKAEF